MEVSVLAGLVGTIIAVITSIISLAHWLGRKFARIDMRLKQLEREFDARLQRLEERFDIRFQRFNARFQQLEERFDMRLKQLEREFSARFQQLERRIDSLASFTRSTYTLLIDFMTMKGTIHKRGESFLDQRG